MQITQVATTSDGPQVNAARTWLINSAIGVTPQQRFRQELYLRFVLDGNADGLHIVPEQTRWRGRFAAYSYNAKTIANPALVAAMKAADQAVLVELAAPRQLTAVQLVSSLTLGLSSKVKVHRVDGEQVVEEPTVEATFGAQELDLTPRPPLQLGEGEKVSSVQRTVFVPTVAALATDFTDARFALRLKNSSTTLTPAHLAGLTVRSYPSAPRLGVAAATAPITPTFFLRLDGEIGKDGNANAGQFDAGEALASALQGEVERFFTQLFADTASEEELVLPTALTVTLVVESDAPCQLVIDEFTVGYQLVRRNFPDRAEKRILRFVGEAVATQRIALALPKSAIVTAATLTIAAKLQKAGLAPPATASSLLAESLAQATGVHLGLERWAAQPLTPPQSLTTSGIMVGLLALTANPQLALELYADWQGQLGKPLVATSLTLESSGQRVWQTVRFAEPLLLFAQPYWLLLKATRGAALWLGQAGTPALQMLTQENQRWQSVNAIANTQGLVHWLSPVAAGSKQPAPLTLQIDDVPMTTTPVATGDRQRHDFTAALNAALAARAATQSRTPTLTFTTGQAGLLTIYPPEILYEVGHTHRIQG